MKGEFSEWNKWATTGVRPVLQVDRREKHEMLQLSLRNALVKTAINYLISGVLSSIIIICSVNMQFLSNMESETKQMKLEYGVVTIESSDISHSTKMTV